MTLKKRISTIAYAIGFSVLALVFIIAQLYNLEYKVLTADPAYINTSNPFIGALSSIGILLWTVTASICFFSASILSQRKDYIYARFLLFSGIFTSILLLDDLFMLHDYVFSKYFGIKQIVTYSIYCVLALVYLYKFRVIINSSLILLLIVFALFGASIFLDLFIPDNNIKYFLEDALKFLGIIGWLAFFIEISIKKIAQKQFIQN